MARRGVHLTDAQWVRIEPLLSSLPRTRLDPSAQIEAWDLTAKVTFDRTLLTELASCRFREAHAHVTIVGPVGVGKTFLAHALCHIACPRGATVRAVRTDQLLKSPTHTRLDHTYEAEFGQVIAVDLLLLGDFAHDTRETTERRAIDELLALT